MLRRCFFFARCLFADFFFKIKFFSKKNFNNIIRVSNSLDQDHARRSVGPDLGPKMFSMASSILSSVALGRVNNKCNMKTIIEMSLYDIPRPTKNKQNAQTA